jgi:hypothetical protein
VTTKSSVFWDVTLYVLVYRSQRFEGIRFLHFQGGKLSSVGKRGKHYVWSFIIVNLTSCETQWIYLLRPAAVAGRHFTPPSPISNQNSSGPFSQNILHRPFCSQRTTSPFQADILPVGRCSLPFSPPSYPNICNFFPHIPYSYTLKMEATDSPETLVPS